MYKLQHTSFKLTLINLKRFIKEVILKRNYLWIRYNNLNTQKEIIFLKSNLK